MSDSFNLLTNQSQDVDGPTVYIPLTGETVTLTVTGGCGGGTVYVDFHVPSDVWANVPQLTLTDAAPSASFTFASGDAIRAHLVGALPGAANATVALTINP
jgi:hypothetical protein